MSKYTWWARLGLLAVVLATTAIAAKKEASGSSAPSAWKFSGSAEGGYNFTWMTTATSGINDSIFFLDYLKMNTTVDVSDKTQVVFNNAFVVGNQRTRALGNTHGSAAYFSPYLLGGSNLLMYNNNAAYISHKCAEGFHTQFGNVPMPYGMESMWDRYDYHTYYYSHGMTRASALEWTYDVGFKFVLSEFLPGKLEFAVTEGVRTGEQYSPATALRWAGDFKGGDMTFSPVISTYMGRWRGGPKDLGITGGLGLKASMWWANFEFQYMGVNSAVDDDTTKRKDINVGLEPGVDLGFMSLSGKFEWTSVQVNDATAATSDMNLGLALSHVYGGNFRVKLAYMHTGLSGNFNLGGAGTGSGHINDLRLMVGTKF